MRSRILLTREIMRIKRIFGFLGIGLIASLGIKAQNNIAEEVAWMIGDQPIYKSEIEEAYRQALYERTPINGDPYCVIPENLAIEKLFLHQADMDTVEIPASQVNAAVDQRINYFITNLGSKEKVEEYFRKPLPEFREQMTEVMRNQYRIQEVQRGLTKNLKVTPAEVRKYFNSLPEDSIPYVPLQVEVQVITLNPVIPREEIENVKARLRDYADRVTRGESDFSTLAILYSEDPGSQPYGGEIGFQGRGHLEPEYAAAAFNLNDTKKVSKIVETQYGYHIIQLIEKRGDRVNTRHILLRPKVSDEDLIKSIHRLDSVRSDILEGKFTFEEIVPFISQDKDTRNNKGIMYNSDDGTTMWKMQDLPQEIAKVVNTMQPGEISEAFIMKDKKNSDVVSIVKLTSRLDGHRANLSDDYQLIKGMYEQQLRADVIKKWLAKKISETYIKIEDGWADCTFTNEGWIKR